MHDRVPEMHARMGPSVILLPGKSDKGDPFGMNADLIAKIVALIGQVFSDVR